MLFAGRASKALAKEVAQHLGIDCGSVDIRDFANGETYARFGESVRGTDAFVIQTHAFPVNERIMEQLIMIDALKRASAKRISAVMPYYGYSRQDKKARSREPITAKDRKSTRLNSSHANISYAVFCLTKKTHPPPPVISTSQRRRISLQTLPARTASGCFRSPGGSKELRATPRGIAYRRSQRHNYSRQ